MAPGHKLIKIPSIIYVIINIFRGLIGIILLFSTFAFNDIRSNLTQDQNFDMLLEMFNSEAFRNSSEVIAVLAAMDVDYNLLSDEEFLFSLVEFMAAQIRIFGIGFTAMAFIGLIVGISGIKNCGDIDKSGRLIGLALIGIFAEAAAIIFVMSSAIGALGIFSVVPSALLILYFVGALKNKAQA